MFPFGMSDKFAYYHLSGERQKKSMLCCKVGNKEESHIWLQGKEVNITKKFSSFSP